MLRTADSRGRLSLHNSSLSPHNSPHILFPHGLSMAMKSGLFAGDEAVLIPDRFRAAHADECVRRNAERYTLKDEPQPQVLLTFGFSNLKPAPSRVST